MVEADLITQVRSKIGKVTSVKGEVEDSDIQTYYGWILKRFGEYITIRQLRYITGEADTREYSVPNTVLRVQDVLPWDAIDESSLSPSEMGATHRAQSGGEGETFNFPSTYIIKMQRKMRGLNRIRFEFDPIERKLRIDPFPTSDGDKYWYKSVEMSKWTLAALPEDMEEITVIGTSWRALEQVLLVRSSLGGIIREGGFVSYPAAELKNYVETWKEEFESLLTVKGMIYSR